MAGFAFSRLTPGAPLLGLSFLSALAGGLNVVAGLLVLRTRLAGAVMGEMERITFSQRRDYFNAPAQRARTVRAVRLRILEAIDPCEELVLAIHAAAFGQYLANGRAHEIDQECQQNSHGV